MGCSASRSDGLEHEEALQHVIQMMRELKVKQIANIAARREGRRSREKYYGWAGVQGARAIAGGDAVLRRASIAHANWRRGGPIDVVAPPGTLLDLPSDVTDTNAPELATSMPMPGAPSSAAFVACGIDPPRVESPQAST